MAEPWTRLEKLHALEVVGIFIGVVFTFILAYSAIVQSVSMVSPTDAVLALRFVSAVALVIGFVVFGFAVAKIRRINERSKHAALSQGTAIQPDVVTPRVGPGMDLNELDETPTRRLPPDPLSGDEIIFKGRLMVNVGGYREILLPLKEGDNIVGTATGTNGDFDWFFLDGFGFNDFATARRNGKYSPFPPDGHGKSEPIYRRATGSGDWYLVFAGKGWNIQRLIDVEVKRVRRA